MIIGDIPTELLLRMRERFLDGRASVWSFTERQEWLREFEQKMIEALDNELRRRLH
jgi:hypothetical protein